MGENIEGFAVLPQQCDCNATVGLPPNCPQTFRRGLRCENTSSHKPFACGYFRSARATGLEPATTGSTVRYSNQLSYAPKVFPVNQLGSCTRALRPPALPYFTGLSASFQAVLVHSRTRSLPRRPASQVA